MPTAKSSHHWVQKLKDERMSLGLLLTSFPLHKLPLRPSLESRVLSPQTVTSINPENSREQLKVPAHSFLQFSVLIGLTCSEYPRAWPREQEMGVTMLHWGDIPHPAMGTIPALFWPRLFLRQIFHLPQKQNIHSIMRILRSKINKCSKLLISRPGEPEGIS